MLIVVKCSFKFCLCIWCINGIIVFVNISIISIRLNRVFWLISVIVVYISDNLVKLICSLRDCGV